MNASIQELISERLDQLKSKGLVAEYLVGWRGPAGRLDPNLTVWVADPQSKDALESELQWLVGDLVEASELTILSTS